MTSLTSGSEAAYKAATDVLELQACIRDLMSLLALPALWSGREPLAIIKLLCEALEAVLPVDVCYVATQFLAGDNPLTVLRVERIAIPLDDPAWREFIDLCDTAATGESVVVAPRTPLGSLRVARLPMGFYGHGGLVCVGSRLGKFPVATHIVYLRAAASLAASGLRTARLVREREQAQAVAEKARVEAEAANRAKSEFLANMSHEIRTPMSAILGYADILSAHLDDPDNLTSVQIIRQNGQHLLGLINDILDLSKIEAGRLGIEQKHVALAGLFAETHSLMAVRAAEKGLAFDVELDGELPETIESDPRRLRQILINLVGNAIKYTERGGVRLKVRLVEAGHAEPKLEIKVIDTGPGISKEQQRLLFQPFAQLDNSSTRVHEGSGLGLTISRRLAEMLGGTITLESRERHGCTFVLTIPAGSLAGIARSHLQLDLASPRPAPATDPTLRLNARVLVVDDRHDMRYLIRRLLEDAGAEVITVGGGQAALETIDQTEAQHQTIDAVVMDMQMPDMDGYCTARRLRARSFNRPIIALTARAMKGEREKCLTAGCSDYLSKPVDAVSLISAIKRAIGDDTDLLRDNTSSQAPAGAAGCRVLVVDDSRDAANALAELLKLFGVDAVAAFDGHSALAKAQTYLPQVAVVDINLPDMSGFEVVKQLKQNPELSRTLCIALSGESSDDPDSTGEGFDHRLLKPLEIHDLIKLLPTGKPVE